MWFSSDNAGPAHPKVMAALAAANEGYAGSYGADTQMQAVRGLIREVFEAPEAEVFLVATGTAANVLGLATLCPPWATIYAHTHAHIEEDECAAPEFYTGGAKLTLLPGADAKIDLDALRDALDGTPDGFVHHVQHGALSLTNVTERGAVYTAGEIAERAALARAHGIPVHLDGARFANALVATNASPAEMTWRAGVDVLSLGGTKNGLMAAEAVVLFDPARAWEFELRRKRGAHLFSKHRFLSAQMLAYLQDGLWLDLARAANQSATALAEGLADLPGARMLHPVEANMIFADLPRRTHDALHAAGAHYYFWTKDPPPDALPDATFAARFVTNWATEPEDVDAFLSAARAA
ncbi:MAG: beta-eliminating lyase-related protein [Pseudomonadota bacterium]